MSANNQSELNLDALSENGSESKQKEQSSTPSIEEYFRAKLIDGIDGDPRRLAANYEKLREAILLEAVNHKKANAALSPQARERADKVNQGNTDSLYQLLDTIYYAETAEVKVRIAPLPPAPVFQAPEIKKDNSTIYNVLAFMSFLLFIPIMMLLVPIFRKTIGMIFVFPLALIGAGIVFGIFHAIAEDSQKKHLDSLAIYKEAEASHAAEYERWERLKAEMELRQRAEKGRDELSKILRNSKL